MLGAGVWSVLLMPTKRFRVFSSGLSVLEPCHLSQVAVNALLLIVTDNTDTIWKKNIDICNFTGLEPDEI